MTEFSLLLSYHFLIWGWWLMIVHQTIVQIGLWGLLASSPDIGTLASPLVVLYPWFLQELSNPTDVVFESLLDVPIPKWLHLLQLVFNGSNPHKAHLQPDFISYHGMPNPLTNSTSSLPRWTAYWFLFEWLAKSLFYTLGDGSNYGFIHSTF